MTDEQIENVWRQYVLPAYRKNEGHRLYAITPESKRQWVALFRARRDTTESFATVVAVFGLLARLLPACVGRWLICLLSFLWLSVAYLLLAFLLYNLLGIFVPIVPPLLTLLACGFLGFIAQQIHKRSHGMVHG
jgi:hypothetical protein